MRKYIGIDIGRLFFSCLIPILHIPFSDNLGIVVIRQYISRLGVPFFFALSGMFLTSSISRYGRAGTLKRYLTRIGRLLLIWLLIYSPFLIYRAESFEKIIQQYAFKTPAYLWFLTSLLFAAIPFCLVQNRKVLYGCVVILYISGTLFGDAYKWLIGGAPSYEKIFLTTRNGLFFGLPLMCVGELTWRAEKRSFSLLIVSGLILIAEITFVGLHTGKLDDRSMYFSLPLFIYALVLVFREWNPQIDNKFFGGISSAIYLMQYGIITVGTIVFKRARWYEEYAMLIVYISVIFIPVVLYWLLRNKKIVKYIF